MICPPAESEAPAFGFKADVYAQLTEYPSLSARKFHGRHPFCSAYQISR